MGPWQPFPGSVPLPVWLRAGCSLLGLQGTSEGQSERALLSAASLPSEHTRIVQGDEVKERTLHLGKTRTKHARYIFLLLTRQLCQNKYSISG